MYNLVGQTQSRKRENAKLHISRFLLVHIFRWVLQLVITFLLYHSCKMPCHYTNKFIFSLNNPENTYKLHRKERDWLYMLYRKQGDWQHILGKNTFIQWQIGANFDWNAMKCDWWLWWHVKLAFMQCTMSLNENFTAHHTPLLQFVLQKKKLSSKLESCPQPWQLQFYGRMDSLWRVNEL